jgi:hypothetical protein
MRLNLFFGLFGIDCILVVKPSYFPYLSCEDVSAKTVRHIDK